MTGLFGMFLTALAAASPLPLPSEPVFLAMLAAGWAALPLWGAATAGNVLGACITFACGRAVIRFQDRRWFPASRAQMAKAEAWFNRWGRWSLLVTFLPGGDALVLVAGALRVPVPVFLVLVTLAKGGRYAALALAMAGISAGAA
ncbi:YqaA family protein [Xinfangfangia pollutisoli]|uniref:YqaA family protein n=1 Tax=Xinfangfangia pollutisoli TaxID=2865960 RepID=UPI001CD20892|nr:VTT domain-containing protein [Xinfangfangia pollutisoli]